MKLCVVQFKAYKLIYNFIINNIFQCLKNEITVSNSCCT